MEISRALRRLAVLLIVFWIRANAEREIECNGRDFECEDAYNFITCINLPDGQQLYIPNRCKPGTVCNNTNVPDEPCDSKSVAKLLESTASTSTADPPTTLSEKSTTPFLRPTIKPEVIANETNKIVPDDIEFVSFSFGLNNNNISGSIRNNTANVTTLLNVEPQGIVKTSSKVTLAKDDVTNLTTSGSPLSNPGSVVQTNTTIQKVSGYSSSTQFVISTLTQAVFQSSGFMSQSIIAFNRGSRSKDSSSVSVNVTTGFSDSEASKDDVTFTTNTTVQFAESTNNESSPPFVEKAPPFNVPEPPRLSEEVPVETPCQCRESHVMPSESSKVDKSNKVKSSSIPTESRPENNFIETNAIESISLNNFTGKQNESQNDIVIVTKDLSTSSDRRENEPLVSQPNALVTKVKNESADIFSLFEDDEEASGDGILYEDIETTTNILPEDKVLVVSSSRTSGGMYLNSADSTITSMLSKDNLIPAKFEIKGDTTKQAGLRANETVQIVENINTTSVTKLLTKDIEENDSEKNSGKVSKVGAPDELLLDVSTRNVSDTKLTTEDNSTPLTELNITAANLYAAENSTHSQSSTNPLNLTIKFRNNVEALPEANSEHSSLVNFETVQLNDTKANEMTLKPEMAAQSNSVNVDVLKENLLSLDDKDTDVSVNITNINADFENRSDIAHRMDFEAANVAESNKEKNISSMLLVQVNNITELNNTKREEAYQIFNSSEQAVAVDGATEKQPINYIDKSGNDGQDNPIPTFDKAEITTIKSTNLDFETNTQRLTESDIQSNISTGTTELEKQAEYEKKLNVQSEYIGPILDSTIAPISDVDSVTEQMEFMTILTNAKFFATSSTPNQVIQEEEEVEFITSIADEQILDLELTTEAQSQTTDEPSMPTTQGSLIETTKVPFSDTIEEDLKQQNELGKIRYADIDFYDAETKRKENIPRSERKATALTESDIKSTEPTTLPSTIDEESTNEPLGYQRLNQQSNKNAELMTISPNWPDLDQLKPHPAVKETTLVNLLADVPVIVESDIDLLATEAPLEETEAPITEETHITESGPTKSLSVDLDVTESNLEDDVAVTKPVNENHSFNLDSSGTVTASVLLTQATLNASTSNKNNLNSTHSQTDYKIEPADIIETTETAIDDTEVKKRAVNKSDHEIIAELAMGFEIRTQNETSAQITRENTLISLNKIQHENITAESEKEDPNITILANDIADVIEQNQNTSTHFGFFDTAASSSIQNKSDQARPSLDTSSSIQNKSDQAVTGEVGNAIFEDSNQTSSTTSSILSETQNSTSLSSLDISSQAKSNNKRPSRYNATSESIDNTLTMNSTIKSPDSVTEVSGPSSTVSANTLNADTVNKTITKTSVSPPTVQSTTMSTQNVDRRDAADFHGKYFPPEAPQIVSIVSQTGARPPANATSPSKPKGTFVCANHGVYPDEDDCKQYFLCVLQNNGYVKITGMCPDRYAFSFEIQRCVRDVSSCYEEKCVKAGNFTDPLDDTSFFWCNEVASGVFHKYHMECDATLKFLPETSTCGIPEKSTSAVSSVRNSTEVAQGIITHNATVNTTTSPVLIEPNYRLLSATTNSYEKRFIEMFNSSNTNQLNSTAAGLKPQESEADLVRRSTRSVPDRNQSSFQCTRQGIYPHPANCSQYYMCVKKIPNEISHILRECPERYAYRADIRACSRDLSVCRNIYCRGMGNHPHPTEENSYYRCVPNAGGGYRVYHIRCEPGKIFIPDQNSCSGDTNQASSLKNSSLRVLTSTEVPTGGRIISKRSTVDPANDPETQSNGSAVSEAYRREAEQRLRRILSEKRDEAARQYDAKMSENQNVIESEASESETSSGSRERTHSRSHEDTFEMVCREEGRFPDPTNCRKYFICSARKTQGLTLHHLDCRGSDRFDATKRLCVSEEDVRCA